MKKLLPLILSTLLLTSCSGPDSSGGVEFSKTDNAFPYGDCHSPGHQTHSTEKTGCGWFLIYTKNYIWAHAGLTNANLSGANLSDAYLHGGSLDNANLTNADLTYANLTNADLTGANLTDANLSGANLSNAALSGVKANSSTICPNGIHWGTSGNNCGFTTSRGFGPGPGPGFGPGHRKIYCDPRGIPASGAWCAGDLLALGGYGWPLDCSAANLYGEMCGPRKCGPGRAKIRRYICEAGYSNGYNATAGRCDESPSQGGRTNVCWISNTGGGIRVLP